MTRPMSKPSWIFLVPTNVRLRSKRYESMPFSQSAETYLRSLVSFSVETVQTKCQIKALVFSKFVFQRRKQTNLKSNRLGCQSLLLFPSRQFKQSFNSFNSQRLWCLFEWVHIKQNLKSKRSGYQSLFFPIQTCSKIF